MAEDLILPIVGCVTAMVILLVPQFIKYKLKVEQIRADALVRAEEVKAKNQLELERLMHRDSSDDKNFSVDERKVREKA